MANLDRPAGFRLYQPKPGTIPQVRLVDLVTSAKVYPGQPLELSSGLYQASDNADDDVRAIAIGYADQALGQKALAIINPEDCQWRVQIDGAVALSHTGQYFKHSVTAADTVTKQARNELTYSTASATIGKAGADLGRRWELIGLVPEEGNAWGTNADVIVTFRKNLA
jgi:hypothetical protein